MLKSCLSEILLSCSANSVLYNAQWAYFTIRLVLLRFYCLNFIDNLPNLTFWPRKSIPNRKYFNCSRIGYFSCSWQDRRRDRKKNGRSGCDARNKHLTDDRRQKSRWSRQQHGNAFLNHEFCKIFFRSIMVNYEKITINRWNKGVGETSWSGKSENLSS